MKLKICKVCDLATGFNLAEVGVHFLGFHVIEDTAREKEERAVSINRQLRASGHDVGVLLTKSADHNWICSIAEAGRFSYVQLHRSAEVAEVAALAVGLNAVSAGLIQVVDAEQHSESYVDRVLAHAMFVLFDNYTGGTGRQIRDAELSRFPLDRAFVAGGIDAARAVALRDGLRPYAVDVQSWADILPDHTKDYGRVAALLNAIG